MPDKPKKPEAAPADKPSSTPIEPGSTPLRNAKWEKFAQLIVGGMKAEDAYVHIGFKRSPDNARRLRNREPVLIRTEWLKAASARLIIDANVAAIDTAGLNREWVLTRLMENVERSMQAKEITVGGVPTGEYKYDGAVANKALELLGKEVGLFTKDGGQLPASPEDSIRDVPDVVEALDRLKQARKLVVVEGGKKAES